MKHTKVPSRATLRLILALLCTAAVSAAAIPGLCNTGRSVAGNCSSALVPPDNGTTTDGNWQLAVPYPSSPSSKPITDPCALQKWTPAWVDLPDTPPWLADSNTISEWITPQVEVSNGGYYVYRLLLKVPTTAVSATIAGKLLSDNEVYQVFLGGPAGTACNLVAGTPLNPAPGTFSAWFSFSFAGPVIPGTTNGLYFVVRNRGAGGIDSSPTAAGLRIQFNQTTSHY